MLIFWHFAVKGRLPNKFETVTIPHPAVQGFRDPETTGAEAGLIGAYDTAAVDEWSRDVWSAYAERRDVAREWIRVALDRRPDR